MQPAPETPPLDSLFEELRALPTLPPRREMLAGLRWKSLFGTPIWFIFPFLVFFCFIPFIFVQTAKNNRAKDGRATARIIQAEPIDNQQTGQPQTFLKYRFRHNGRDYASTTLASPTSPLSMQRVGNSFEIAFDPSRPQHNFPASQVAQDEVPWFVFVIFPLFFGAFLLPLFLPQLRTLWLARRLFARGVLTTGRMKIVKNAPMPTPFMPFGSHQVFYEFDDENGQCHRGTMRCDNSWLAMQWKPESPVVVAYNPRKPRQNIILEPFVA